MKRFSIKKIQSALRDCYFNPNIPGPMQIIADIDNVSYYENRAVEILMELNRSAIFEDTHWEEKYNFAIQLIILAKLKRNETQTEL